MWKDWSWTNTQCCSSNCSDRQQNNAEQNSWNPSWDSEWACPEHKPNAINECSSSTFIFSKHKYSAFYCPSNAYKQNEMKSAVNYWYCKNETQNRIWKNRLHKLRIYFQLYTSLFLNSKVIERINWEHACYHAARPLKLHNSIKICSNYSTCPVILFQSVVP